MKKRLLAVLLVLVLVVSLMPLAAHAANECTSANSPDGNHKWVEHNYGTFTNSVCDYCEKSCYRHVFDKNEGTGACTTCGVLCSHSGKLGFNNGECSNCGYDCPHTNYGSNNKCSVCKMEKPKCTEHVYNELGECSNCGAACQHTETKELPAVAATCGVAGKTAGTQCKDCDKILTAQQNIAPTGKHSVTVLFGYKAGQEPTCTTGGVAIYKCENCSYNVERDVPASHKGKIVENWESTCDKQGGTVYVCEREGCGEKWYKLYDKAAHYDVTLPAVAATCTETGLTAGKKCTACQEILIAQEVVPANGHDWETVEAKAATCTTDGNNAYKVCKTCGATLNKEIIKAAHDYSQNPNKCSVCQSRNPDCQHNNASITVTKEPTCKSIGTQTFKCNDCGDTYNETLSMLDYHNYVDGTCTWCMAESCNHNNVIVYPTCTEDGYVYCTKCHKEFRGNHDALGHDYDNNVEFHFCTRCGTPDPNAVTGSASSNNNMTQDFQDIFGLG